MEKLLFVIFCILSLKVHCENTLTVKIQERETYVYTCYKYEVRDSDLLEKMMSIVKESYLKKNAKLAYMNLCTNRDGYCFFAYDSLPIIYHPRFESSAYFTYGCLLYDSITIFIRHIELDGLLVKTEEQCKVNVSNLNCHFYCLCYQFDKKGNLIKEYDFNNVFVE